MEEKTQFSIWYFAFALRAGRFDRQVAVDRPDKTGRIAILGVHMKKITLALGLDAAKIADLMPGFTGAELANLCNEAALAATPVLPLPKAA